MSDVPFYVLMGCDYERNYRETGFHVTGVDEKGISVADPCFHSTIAWAVPEAAHQSPKHSDMWRDLPLRQLPNN